MNSDESKSLALHLNELRKLIIEIIIFLVIGFVVSFAFLTEKAVEFIKKPLIARSISVVYTTLPEVFVCKIELSAIIGAIIVSPFIMFLLWKYIKPALYKEEIKKFKVLFVVCLILFATGIAFAYFVVYRFLLDFFIVVGNDVGQPLFSIGKYVSFLFSFLLPFGIAFELPVIIYMLSSHGIVSYDKLKSFRKYVLLFIVTLSAILTPPDALSQIMLSVPLYLLYEVGILVARLSDEKN